MAERVSLMEILYLSSLFAPWVLKGFHLVLSQAPLRIRPPLVGRMSPGAVSIPLLGGAICLLADAHLQHRVRGIWPFLRGHIMALNAGRPGPVMQMLADMDMAVTGM